jgi:ABC-type branched-subunit amino acid transport system substrate-binding protein
MACGTPVPFGSDQSSRRMRVLVHKLRLVVVASLAGLITMGVAGCGGSTGGASSGPLTIGGVIAITGASDFEGQNQAGGINPAIYAINHAGGVLGHKLVYKGVDTRGDPADALPAVQQMLATTSNLTAVAGPDTSSAPTLVPVLNSAKVPMMAVAGESSFDHNTSKYFWRLFPPDSANGTAMTLWAQRKGYTRIATVFGTDSGSQGDLPGVLASIKALHMTLVSQVNITPSQPTYLSSVREVMAAHPQVIMTESDATTGGTFFGELKQLGGLVPIIGTEATFTAPWLTAVKGALGSDFVPMYTGLITAPAPSSATAAVNAYEAAVNGDKAQVPSPYKSYLSNPFSQTYYDGLVAMALAMIATHSTNPSVFNDAMPEVTNPGAGKTVVYTFPQGKAALDAGKKIQYIGATGVINFNQYHNSFGDQQAVGSTSSLQPTPLGTVTAKDIEAVPVTGVA